MGIMVEFVREEPSGMDRGQQISGEKGVWKVLSDEETKEEEEVNLCLRIRL